MAVGASNVRVYEFEKNRALVSNQSAHETDPQTFVTYTDIVNDVAGRRRKRPGTSAAKGANAGAEITAIHEFLRTDTTTGVETYYLFRTYGATIERWTGAAWATSPLPFVATSAAWVFKNFNNRCFATNGKNHLVYFDGSTGAVDGREWFYVGVDAPLVAPGYSPLTLTEYTTGTVSVTNGSTIIVGDGLTVWVTGGAWNDKWIDIAGVRYRINTVDTITPGSITLKQPYTGPTAAGVTYVIYTGLMDWEEGHWYAIAYKHSNGHYSNISPKIQITEKDQVGRTVTLTGIPYSAEAFKNGYNEIQIFRSGKNGTTLVAIGGANGVIPNANLGGTTSWSETAGPPSTYRDADLTTLEAPLVTNRRPVDDSGNPLAFTALGEWSGRLYALCPRLSQAFYSGAPEDVRVGLPEFCWPLKYSLRVNGARGVVELGTGSDTDQLVIHTASGDSTIIGYDPLSFRIRRVETRNSEGFQGGSTSVGGQLVEMHRDKRLIDYGKQQDLGQAIQDKLRSCNPAAFTKSKVTWFSYSERDFLLISVPSTAVSAVNDRTFIYDYDLENVYDWSLGFSAFCSVHNVATGELELWAGTSTGDVVQLLGTATTDNGVNIVPSLKTAWMRPAGENGRVQMQWIEIFTPETAAFTGKLYLDEETNLTDPGAKGTAFTLEAPQSQYQSAKARKFRWKPSRPFIFNSAQIEIVAPSTAADIVIEKIIVCVRIVNESQVVL